MSRFVIGFAFLLTAPSFAAEPKVLDDRLKLELFAEQPQIVTPTGIDVDHLGRVWAIESNTHFPPEGYKGHPTDRVLILEDTNADGKADKVTPFIDGLTHAMSVVVKPVWLEGLESRVESREPDKNKKSDANSSAGSRLSTLDSRPTLFLATRKEILRLRDTDGDLKADARTTLVRLDTPGNYPHNGLAGIAFDALGWMFFGFGENLGADYKIIGSDGVTLSGGGEGGNMYRCRPDGTKLERWATGFWNPHASCFDAFGRLFTVDNDPDSRPPCRLLHIIPGGDYGYRFRNGRKGTHPFTSWNGEIPGTLPMVSGTGEAPSGIVCYESDGFPDDYLGTLLVGSWGDHRIDQFVLEPKGASFVSKPKPVVQGDDTFRPVGLALAPDGSVYFSDWVLRDYKLHGKGRVWRLSGKNQRSTAVVSSPEIGSKLSDEMLRNYLESKRLDVRRRAATALVERLEGNAEAIDAEILALSQKESRTFAAWMQAVTKAVDDGLLKPTFRSIEFGNETADAKLAADLATIHRRVIQRTDDPFILTNRLNRWGQDVPSSATLTAEFQEAAAIAGVEVPPDIQRERMQTACMLLGRRLHPKDQVLAHLGLAAANATIRRMAVQWVGEEGLKPLRPAIQSLLGNPQTTPDLFLACLATLSLLDGVPAAEFEKTPPTHYLLPMLTDRSKPAALRATALRLLPAATAELPTGLLVEFLNSDDATLQLEAVRTLAQSPRGEAVGALMEIVAKPQASLELRCEALVALSAVGPNAPESARIEAVLLDGIENRLRLRDPNDAEPLQLEAIRAVRNRANDGKFREALEKTREAASVGSAVREAIEFALAGKSSSDSQLSTLNSQLPSPGRRVFFSPHGPHCAKCHTVHGRGGQVGPDLSVIARTMSREKLFDSIVNPSKEVSPQFLTWAITTTDGKVHTGIIVTENGGGDVELGDAQGNVIKVPRGQIEERTPSPVSVMPQGLHQRMTPREFAELISYLETLK